MQTGESATASNKFRSLKRGPSGGMERMISEDSGLNSGLPNENDAADFSRQATMIANELQAVVPGHEINSGTTTLMLVQGKAAETPISSQ